MSYTLNFEHCHLATGNNIRADNIALLLPESSLTGSTTPRCGRWLLLTTNCGRKVCISTSWAFPV